MKFLRSSITLKFILFLIVASVPLFSGIFYLLDLDQRSKMILFGLACSFLVIAILGYAVVIVGPLQRITKQVKLLLTGKKYKRVRPKSPDEIGIFAHFFNEITLNLEKISSDIVQQKRLFSEIDLARQIQQDVLPKKAENIEGLEVIAKTKSAAEVGGDSFDFIQRGENTMIYIGDVTGHGLPAGLVMMMVNSLMHAFLNGEDPIDESLARVNDILWDRISSSRFMTLVMMRWDAFKRKMYFTGAGHEHILIYRAKTKEVEAIKAGGIALRMIPDIRGIVREVEVPMEEGDIALLYTDGITEGRNEKGEMYEIERLKESLRKNGFRSTTEAVFDRISEEFSDFVGNNFVQEDDITMILMKRLSEGQEQRTAVKMMINAHDSREVSESKQWDW